MASSGFSPFRHEAASRQVEAACIGVSVAEAAAPKCVVFRPKMQRIRAPDLAPPASRLLRFAVEVLDRGALFNSL